MGKLAIHKPHRLPSKRVASGPYADVWLFGSALTNFEALSSRTDETSERELQTLRRYLERFAQSGEDNWSDKMFKAEGRFPDGAGGKVLVSAFKAYQFRVYGSVKAYRGKRSYLGVECDPNKKKRKARMALLKSAARLIREIIDEERGTGNG